MITNKHDSTTNGSYKVLRGLSSDTKPDAVANGSEFLEMDTGKTYLFDEDGTTWAEQPASGGGGVSVQALTVAKNGTYTAPEGKAYSPVTVDVQDSKSDVNFYDYDGTVVASYTAADFANLSAMPDNPDHTDEGLVAQGWNWSLADAQTYVASYGKLEIGQMYDTDDGATRIVIDLHAPRLSPLLRVSLDGSATVDWGDGNTDTITALYYGVADKRHTYATEGTYTISILLPEGQKMRLSDRVISGTGSNNGAADELYGNEVLSARISSSVDILSSNAFSYCPSLASVTIANGVTQIVTNPLSNDYLLQHVTIPSSVTRIGGSVFQQNYMLESVSIPNSVTSVGDAIFNECYLLQHVTIPSSVTSISNNMFKGCQSITSAHIPSSITSIGNQAFYGNKRLSSVTIPDSVTSIGSEAFALCGALLSITIPRSVTSINSSAFGWCKGLASVRFECATPPTLGSSSVFADLPTDCVIYVPTGTLSAYTSATNYPSSSTYTYVEY